MTNTKNIKPGRYALLVSPYINGTVGKYGWLIDKVSGSRVYLSRIIRRRDGEVSKEERFVSAGTIHSTYDTEADANEVGDFDFRLLKQIRDLEEIHKSALIDLINKKGGAR